MDATANAVCYGSMVPVDKIAYLNLFTGRESEDHTMASDDGALRPRRRRVTINYKEPSLNW